MKDLTAAPSEEQLPPTDTGPGVGRVPAQALVLSLLSLAVPVVSSSVVPSWTNEAVGFLVWLLALIPAFLLSFYRGWRGASIALAAGMAAFSVAQVIASVSGASVPPVNVMVGVIVVLISVSLGSGWMSSRLRGSLDEARELAFSDPGTGLPNRRHAMLHLQRAFAAADRGDKLSVVLFDLDRFKRINDRFGHQTGDEVLQAFADLLADNTREMNLSGRFGGEEFLSVLDGVDQKGAVVFAERIRERLAGMEFPWGGVTVSAGICEYEAGMASPDILVAAADQALYRAKRGGRDRVVVLGPKGRTKSGTLQLTAEDTTGLNVQGRGETVLIVDDDPGVLKVAAKALGREGYHPLQSTDPDKALAIARGLDTPIDLVVVDIVMPKMSGFRFVEILAEFQPVVRALYISGYEKEEVEWSGVPGAVKAFLPKPIPIGRLTEAVRQTLDAPMPEQSEEPDQGTALVETLLRSREEVLEARVSAQSAQLERAYADILLRLAWAVEYRDDMTGQHAERVGRLAGMLAEELELDTEMVELIELAAPLHDLGKIAVPDSLLWKPGALTEAEREVMQDHCWVGARLLSGSPHPLLREARKIALSHHERWDGTGYPQGLAGDDIPLCARITAVADTYDSVTQMRSYRGVQDHESAVEIVSEGRGTQFDPEVVDAFTRLAADGRLAHLEHASLIGGDIQWRRQETTT